MSPTDPYQPRSLTPEHQRKVSLRTTVLTIALRALDTSLAYMEACSPVPETGVTASTVMLYTVVVAHKRRCGQLTYLSSCSKKCA